MLPFKTQCPSELGFKIVSSDVGEVKCPSDLILPGKETQCMSRTDHSSDPIRDPRPATSNLSADSGSS